MLSILRRMRSMKPPVSTATINWLTSSASAPIILEEGHDGYSRTQIPMPPEMGSGWIELFSLAIGMNIARGSHHFEPKMMGQIVPFFDVKGVLNEPTLIVSSARTGQIILKERCVGIDFIFGQGRSLFEYVDRQDYMPMLDGSCDIEVTMLKIGISMLETLLGIPGAHAMLEALNVREVPAAAVCAVPPYISVSLDECMPAHLTGMMRKLHAQSKALEYVGALASHLNVEEAKTGADTVKHKQVLQLREELSRLQGKVPALDELARQYGMSGRVLNEEFKNAYGASIFQYVSDLRLDEAHEALLHTDVPMKSMALNMGYSHVNHFITAFGKKFGYSPGSLRRRKTVQHRDAERSESVV